MPRSSHQPSRIQTVGGGEAHRPDQRLGGDLSALIARRLKQAHGIDLDVWLSPAQRAAAVAFRAMLEEHLYFALLHNRWIEDAHWPLVRDAFLAPLSRPVQDAIRAGIGERLKAQGLGAHEREEIHALAVPEVTALADWLGEQPFFMGERPCEIDCSVFAFTANLLLPTAFDGPLQAEARRHPNLAAYTTRMLRRLFPEWTMVQAA